MSDARSESLPHGPIIALGPVDDAVAEILRPFGPVIPVGPAPATAAVLGAAIGLIARGDTIVNATLIASMPNLRVIGRSGVGTERVDLAAASARRIPVVITPGAGTNAVAEGALAMILHLVKRLGELTVLVRDGRWAERESMAFGDVDGATLGIIGFGRIGRRLSAICRPLGMSVLAFDPLLDAATAGAAGVTATDLVDLVHRSNVVSLHAPLTADTTRLVGAELLNHFRPGSILVNCGRGGLVDLDAVHVALNDGRLAGVGLDVYDPEPPAAAGHPLFRHPGVVLTPHVMGLSTLARQRTFRAMAEGMAAVLGGGRASDVANPELDALT